MKLRDHPLMSYRGVANWPPVWTPRASVNCKTLRGEIGVLRDVFLSNIEPHTRLFLIMEQEDEEYIGCVLFSNGDFCRQVYQLWESRRGMRVAELTELNIDALL